LKLLIEIPCSGKRFMTPVGCDDARSCRAPPDHSNPAHFARFSALVTVEPLA